MPKSGPQYLTLSSDEITLDYDELIVMKYRETLLSFPVTQCLV